MVTGTDMQLQNNTETYTFFVGKTDYNISAMCCTCNHEKKTSSQVEKVWTG
jgi:hypothetical protein